MAKKSRPAANTKSAKGVSDSTSKKEIELKSLLQTENEHKKILEEKLKVINQLAFEAILKETGFELKEVLGDYNLNPFNAASSPRLILIAVKP